MQKPLEPPLHLPAGHPCTDCPVRPIAFCRKLQADTLLDLRSRGRAIQLCAAESLFFEGDAADRVFMVTDGALKLYALLGDGRRQVTGFMFPGDFLGISVEDRFAFSVEALASAELFAFSRTSFAEFCDKHPQVERELYHLAAHELAAAQQQMVLLGRKNAGERLASFFVMLLKRAERISGRDETAVSLPMTRLDIGDYLGLTKETVSRMIAYLRDRKLIRLVSQDCVEVLDRQGLDDLAAGFGDN